MTEELSRSGMPLELPVAVSVLAADGLKEHVLTKYELSSPVRCDLFSRGENDTYLVRADSARYYLRVYNKWREEPEIQAEIEMLGYLHHGQMPVSHPLPRKDGRYLTRIVAPEGERYACLFSNAKGRPIRMTTELSRAYGRLVARIHSCLDELPTDPRRFHLDLDHLIEEPLGYMRGLLGDQSKAYEYLSRIGLEFGSQIEARLPKEKPIYGSCHGDHHGANVHIADDGTMTLFDFDCFGYGWRAYDLAVFLWSQHKNWGWEPESIEEIEQKWDSFLQGYETIRKLSPRELEATKVFVPIRQLWTLGTSFRKVGILGHNKLGRGYLNHSIRFIGSCIREYDLIA